MKKNNFGLLKDLRDFDDKIVRSYSLNVDFNQVNTTSMLDHARNHCASVASSNLEHILGGSSNLHDHYSKIGNGPIITFARKTKSLMKDNHREIDFHTKYVNNLPFIKESIRNGNPLSLLLNQSIGEWHWVICVGYMEYSSGQTVLEIIDNWHQSKSYYIPNKGSRLISATSYFLNKTK